MGLRLLQLQLLPLLLLQVLLLLALQQEQLVFLSARLLSRCAAVGAAAGSSIAISVSVCTSVRSRCGCLVQKQRSQVPQVGG